jgi:hypothetical protein
VELLQQFVETGKAKRVGNIKPRLDNPAGVNLPSLYSLSALDTGVLTIGSANAILNPFVSQGLPDSEHFSHLHPNDYSAGVKGKWAGSVARPLTLRLDSDKENSVTLTFYGYSVSPPKQFHPHPPPLLLYFPLGFPTYNGDSFPFVGQERGNNCPPTNFHNFKASALTAQKSPNLFWHSHFRSPPTDNYSADLKSEAVIKMEEERKLEPTEEWELEPIGYIVIRGLAEGAIENRLQETGDLIIDPTKIDGFFLCKWDGKDYEPKEGEMKFPIYENMHFDLLPQCQACERYFSVTPTQKGIEWLISRLIDRIKDIGRSRLTSLAEIERLGGIKWGIITEAQYYRDRGQNFYEVLDEIKVTLKIPSERIWRMLLMVAGEIFGEAGQDWLNFARDIGDIEVETVLAKMKILRRILP